MKKIGFYLDTTVISHLYAPEKMQETLALWDDIIAGNYEIVLSSVVFDEIDRCYQPKRDIMYEYVNRIEFKNTKINSTIREI